jgi:hypothetical protein
MANICSRPIIVTSLAALSLAGCQARDEEPVVATNDLGEILPLPPIPTPTLDRAGLLDAIRNAASAHSAGMDDSAAQRPLAGRRFALLMPFACPGVDGSADDAQFGLRLRPDGRSYEVRAAPTLTAADAGLTDNDRPASAEVEAIEGFWIERPWMLSARCPRAADLPATAPTAPDDGGPPPTAADATSPAALRTAGIAQILVESESRVGLRSGRDYRVVIRLAEGEVPPSGLVLMIDGRLRAWPGGKVIRCLGRGSLTPPTCIAAADVDRVAFARMDTREVLSEWVK